MEINDLTIVVCCNKKDVYLANICIASIRYFYPDIRIELIKDPGNGNFNTTELERSFNVRVVDLGIKQLGWSGAKFHYLYLQEKKGNKILILDADIVFVGPFLERLLPEILKNDYTVSFEENLHPREEWVKSIFFDIDAVKNAYPNYQYPGYFFNAGQIFLTVGAIEENVLYEFFNPTTYPFWQKNELFPLVDQSVYNYLLPTLHLENKIKLGKAKFMLWAGSHDLKNISLKEVATGNVDEGLIHWAGCVRVNYVKKMLRGDILMFFEDWYYKKIPLGNIKKIKNRVIGYVDFSSRNIYRKTIKSTVHKVAKSLKGQI